MGRRPRDGQLGLRALPAVLQEDGELPGGRGRVPRHGRAADPGAGPGDQPAVPRLLQGRAAGGLLADQGRERLPPGGVRPVRPEHQPGPAAVGGPRLPAPGHAAAQPHRGVPGLRHQDPFRGQARGGRGVPPRPGRRPPGPARGDGAAGPDRGYGWAGPGRGDGAAGPGRGYGWAGPGCADDAAGPGRGGHPVRRRHQLAAVAAAVRGGPGRPAGRARHRAGRRPARRGCEPAGPPGGLRSVRVQAPGLGVARAEVAQPAGGRRSVVVPAQRAGGDQPLRGRRVRAQQRRGPVPEPDVSLPADRDPLRRLGTGRRPRVPGAHRADVLRLPGIGPDRLGRPVRPPGAAVQLPVHCDRPPGMDRGDPHRPADPDPARVQRVQRRRAVTGERRADRRADTRLGRPRRRDGAAPIVHGGHGHRRDVCG